MTTRTGHGYNEASGMFNWPKEYWVDILVAYPKAKKFMTTPLVNKELLKCLFEGTIATEDYAYTTGSEYIPAIQTTSEFVHIVDGDIPMVTDDFGVSRIDNPWDGMNISIDDVPISPTTQPSSASTTPRTLAFGNGSAKGKRVATNVEPSPLSLINELISTIGSNDPGSGFSNNDNTMSEGVCFVIFDMISRLCFAIVDMISRVQLQGQDASPIFQEEEVCKIAHRRVVLRYITEDEIRQEDVLATGGALPAVRYRPEAHSLSNVGSGG
ncbi:hypothetical protein GIB67_007994 [Kingdonia uniflora]|uniref:Uncharacterized protein n=1 Tax=Kingdonia uniflora TaxID=39325 RepID=A0A7J7MMX5_9MAGN|nr:hypothetical protein GIB67_007994 [Kingdonia uniflora]